MSGRPESDSGGPESYSDGPARYLVGPDSDPDDPTRSPDRVDRSTDGPNRSPGKPTIHPTECRESADPQLGTTVVYSRPCLRTATRPGATGRRTRRPVASPALNTGLGVPRPVPLAGCQDLVLQVLLDDSSPKTRLGVPSLATRREQTEQQRHRHPRPREAGRAAHDFGVCCNRGRDGIVASADQRQGQEYLSLPLVRRFSRTKYNLADRTVTSN